jgi:peptidoglycan hydrolase-like protein with peptidoglycan-binding domain
VPSAQKASPSGSDAIGNLIRGSEPAQRSTAEIRPDARVMAVQKALTKLGYGPLKPDGFPRRGNPAGARAL